MMMELVAKLHRYEKILIVLLIEVITTANFVAEVGGHNSVAGGTSIDEFHSSGSRSLLKEPPAPNWNYREKREHLNDLYARQNNNHDSNQGHSRLPYEDPDFNPAYPHSGGDDDDHDSSRQHKHHDYGPTLSAFNDQVLPDNITTGNTEHHIDLSGDNNENNLSNEKLLYLTREIIEQTCRVDRGSERREQLNGTYLTYCSRYKTENLLSNEILMSIMHHDSKDCERILDEFLQLDETINQFDSLFMKLLSRYNCHNGYSVKWNCDDCKKAYKDWLCATHLPYYMNGERIKPCISFCERVEQRCPYLHPITREQYGGQPVFICRDPNIPFVPEITPDIPCSEPGKCYDLCHLSDNLTELINDSLSKYDYDKCPDKSSIASEVRNEQSLTIPNLLNDSRSLPPSTTDSMDYPDQYEDDNNNNNAIIIANRTTNSPTGQTTKVLIGHPDLAKKTHVHNKKLEELREVLANYKNQAKTHRYHADHSSIDQSKSHTETH